MIVVDASAAVAALLNDGQARQVLGAERLHAPHLIDAEIASALSGLANAAAQRQGSPSRTPLSANHANQGARA